MKVLLISPFFYPEKISTGKWNTVVASELDATGINVDVVSSHPIYPSWKPKFSNARLGGLSIHRGGRWLWYPKNNVIRRLVLEGWFTLYVCSYLLVSGRKYDTVVAVSPPVLFIFLLPMFVRKSTRLIGVVHDLLGVMAKSSGSPFRKIVANLMRSVEAIAFQRCDELICLSETMADEISTNYGISKSKCLVFYPFVTLPKVINENILEEIFPENKFHLAA